MLHSVSGVLTTNSTICNYFSCDAPKHSPSTTPPREPVMFLQMVFDEDKIMIAIIIVAVSKYPT